MLYKCLLNKRLIHVANERTGAKLRECVWSPKTLLATPASARQGRSARHVPQLWNAS